MNDMDMSEYQHKARETAIYPDSGELLGLLYVSLGLVGEAGEFAGKVKKMLRDDNGEMTEERRAALEAELGDVLWYVAQVASELGTSLGGVARKNLAKLADRANRGALGGDGDER